jgi:hypothetical protein
MSNHNPIPKPPSSHLDRLAQQSKETDKNQTPPTNVAEKENQTPPANDISKQTEEASEPLTIVFDQNSPNFLAGLDEYNLHFVRNAAQHLNYVLQTRRNLFINDVNDYLGIKRTPEGQLFGWVVTNSRPGRVDIEVTKSGGSYILTPNHQGDIHHLI